MRIGIRTQFLVPLALTLVAVAIASGMAAYAAAGRVRLQTDQRLHAVAETVRSAPYPLTAPVLDMLRGLTGAEVVLRGRDGHLTAARPTAPTTLPSHDGPTTLDGTTYQSLHLVLPASHPDAGGVLYLLYPESQLRQDVLAASWPALMLAAVVGGVAVLVMAGVAGRLVQRVAEVSRQTTRIAAGDFTPIPLPRRNDELRDLAVAVNDMVGRLAVLQEAMQRAERLRLLGQVSGGLAHQLRNGVTGARLAVQLHSRDCPGGHREALTVALRQLDLVESALRKFLDLGRADEPRRQRCDWNLLITEAIALLTPQARHAGTALDWQPTEEPCLMDADPAQIEQMLVNLLTNALEAAGPGGEVHVKLLRQDARAIMTISDTGPGPPPAIAARLFEPFTTGKPGGVGLGLAAARQVAERHGGSVTWQRHGERTEFVVSLPSVTGVPA